MKKLLFLLMALPMFCGCSSDNEESEPIPEVNLSFTKEQISIPVKSESILSINGVKPDDCNVYAEDEHIAYASVYDGKISIDARHVGQTKIFAEHKGKKAECTVDVTSLVNYIGNPVLDFGASKEEVKKKIKGEVIEESEDRLQIKEDFEYPIYVHYHFSDNKLECVYSEINVNTSSVNILNSLIERYEILSSESKVHWFAYPSKFIVRENPRGGNGGYAVRYAKDKGTMAKYYQI